MSLELKIPVRIYDCTIKCRILSVGIRLAWDGRSLFLPQVSQVRNNFFFNPQQKVARAFHTKVHIPFGEHIYFMHIEQHSFVQMPVLFWPMPDWGKYDPLPVGGVGHELIPPGGRGLAAGLLKYTPVENGSSP